MQKQKLDTWKRRFQTLLPPIKHCKICFQDIKISDFCRFFDGEICLCTACQKELEPKFINFTVGRYKALAFYEYSEFVKKQIYLYKGCYDYEMKDIFLTLFIKEIKAYFHDYIVIPAPSYFEDDQKRGFNHVVEVFKKMNLEILQIVEKTERFKQAEKTAKERQLIKKHLRLNRQIDLSKKRVLIVDDIYTTGATMRAMINLVEQLNPKDIKVLVLAKTKSKDDKKLIQI